VWVGDALLCQDQPEPALALFREALALRQRIFDEYGPSAERLRDISLSNVRIGDVLLRQGEVEPALALFREALALAQRIIDEYGSSVERLRDIYVAKDRVGDVLLRQGQVQPAMVLFRESLALAERVLGEYGPSAERLRGVYVAKNRVGNVLLRQDQVEPALALFRESLALTERELGEYGSTQQRLLDITAARRNTSIALLRLGQSEPAFSLMARAKDDDPESRTALPDWLARPGDPAQAAQLDAAFQSPGTWAVEGSTAVTQVAVALWPELKARGNLKFTVQLGPQGSDLALVSGAVNALALHAHAAWLWKGDVLIRLNGRSEPIHLARELAWIDSRSAVSALAFAELFCRYVYANEGPFILLRTADDIPWLPSASDCDRLVVERMQDFAPVVQPHDSDGFMVWATVLHGTALFRAQYRVPVRGEIQMLDDTTLATGLPVFRYRCRDGWHERHDESASIDKPD
jgi:tetratricopeptide (TPR) repeat protein